jgi:hypothetical protein
VLATLGNLGGGASRSDVNVIVVRATGMWLEHHFHRAIHRLARFASCSCPLQEERFDIAIREDPLNAGVGIFDQGFHENPRALDVEAKEPMTFVIERQSVGTDVNESGAFDGRSLEGRHVEEEIGIAAASVREMWKKDAAVFHREITDRQHGSRSLLLDLPSRPFDRLYETRDPVMAIVAAFTTEPFEARSFGG